MYGCSFFQKFRPILEFNAAMRVAQSFSVHTGKPFLHTPVEIKLRKVAKRLDVLFEDGNKFTFSAEFLRVKSPSADNERTGSDGKARITAGRKHVGIMGLEPVGSYAIRVMFDDLHKAGIYTWPYLYDLGMHKMSYSRQYIRALRDRGLSRYPTRRMKPMEEPRSHACKDGASCDHDGHKH